MMAGNPPAVALQEAYGSDCQDNAAFSKLVNSWHSNPPKGAGNDR